MAIGFVIGRLGTSATQTGMKVVARGAVATKSTSDFVNEVSNEGFTWISVVEGLTVALNAAAIIQDINRFRLSPIKDLYESVLKTNAILNKQGFSDETGVASELIANLASRAQRVPVPIVQKAGRAIKVGDDILEKTISDAADANARVLNALQTALPPLEKIEKRMTWISRASLAGSAIVVTDDLIDFVEANEAEVREFLALVGEIYAAPSPRSVQADAGGPLARSTSEPHTAEQWAETDRAPREVLLPERASVRTAEAFDAINARIEARTTLIGDIETVGRRVVQLFSEVIPDGAQAFYDDLIAALNRATELIGALKIEVLGRDLPLIDALGALGGFLTPLQDIARVLNTVFDAIQPVVDLFGPVVDLINEVVSRIERAIGLDRIEDYILDQIRRPLDRIADEIEAKIQELLDALPDFSAFEALLAEFQRVGDMVREYITGNLLEVGGELGETLDGYSIIAGGDGDDVIELSAPDAPDGPWGGLALGDDGDDVIRGTSLGDLLNGGGGADVILGLGGDDVLRGGAGDDELIGGEGDDDLIGDEGDDTLEGGMGADVLAGGEGDDALYGGAGNDLFDGQEGDDRLEGGAGNDVISGGDDEDTLISTGGNDVVDGDAGLDLIRTFGADGVRTILDPDAIFEGGDAQDHVILGAQTIAAASRFSGGAGRDVFAVQSVDLSTLDGRLSGFDVLRIGFDADRPEDGAAGAGAFLTASEMQLAAFDTLAFVGPEAIRVDLTEGDLRFGPALDFSGAPRGANEQDGSLAGEDARPISETVAVALALHDAGGRLVAPAALTAGLTLIGGAGEDSLTGGAGSDLIRPGLGADVISGGPGDGGDRFQLDGAVGDVIRGTAAELDGDRILDFDNRTDRVRIEGAALADVTSRIEGDETVVEVRDGAETRRFVIDGAQGKLLIREGDIGGAYVELLNDNVPPRAEDDFVDDAAPGGEGYDPTVIEDPLANDYDADGPARLIDVAGSLERLFGDARDRVLATELGGEVRFEGGEWVYYGPGSTLEIDRLDFDDPIVVRYPDANRRWDVTQDLPFWGFDRVLGGYDVVDEEGEVSNTAAIDILIRPTRQTLPEGTFERIFAEVEVRSEVSLGEGETASFAERFQLFEVDYAAPPGPGGAPGLELSGRRSGFTNEINRDLGRVYVGNELFEVDRAAAIMSLEGNDVLIARDSAEGVAFFGGNNADWVEGGAGDDFLTAGGFDDERISAPGAVYLTEAGERGEIVKVPEVVVTGGGDNVVTTSFASNSGIPRDFVEDRQTIFLLEGGADYILPPLIGVGATRPDQMGWQSRAGESRIEVAMRALDGDRIIGFDSEDRIILPFRGFRENPAVSEFDSYDPTLINRNLVQYIGDPDGVSDTRWLTPDMIQYDIDVTPRANQGGPDETLVEVTLHFLSVTGAGSAPRMVSSSGSESFSFTLDGTFFDGDGSAFSRDFVLDMVGVDLGDEIPYVEVETLWEAFRDSRGYDRTLSGLRNNPGEPFDAHFKYVDDPDKSLALALRYAPMEVAPLPDEFLVRQDETLSGNVLLNDTGRDLRRAKVWDVALDADFQGEIEFGVDPATGLFDGGFDYRAPDDFLGVTGFEYALRLPGETLAPVRVDFQVFPRTPRGADDDAWVSQTSGALQVADLLANDDFFNTPREAFQSIVIFDAEDSGRFGFGGAIETVDLPDAYLADLRAELEDSLTLEYFINYELRRYDSESVISFTDDNTLPASVTVRLADPLVAAPVAPVTAVEDRSLSVDVLSAVSGGRPDYEIIGVGPLLAEGEILGLAEIVGDGIVVTGLADLFDVAGTLEVQVRDGLGDVLSIPVQVAFEAAPDDAFILPFAADAPAEVTTLAAIEDAPMLGRFAAIDPDVLSPTALDLSPAEFLRVGAALRESLAPRFAGSGDVTLEDEQIFAALRDKVGPASPLIAEDGAVFTEGGGTVSFTRAEDGFYDFAYAPAENFSGLDEAIFTLLEADGEGGVKETAARLLFQVTEVNDAPELDGLGSGEIDLGMILAGDVVSVDLLAGALDPDDDVDPGLLEVINIPDPALALARLAPDGTLEVEATGSGEGIVQVRLFDGRGGASPPRTIRFNGNEAPEARGDGVSLVAPFGPILIDAIANDRDPDGTLDYVRDDAGVPIAIVPDSGGLAGAVAWSEADGAFRYTPPANGQGAGTTEVFHYEVQDDDGAVVRTSVEIVLRDPAQGGVVVGSAAAEDVDAGRGPETFILGDGEDAVAGRLEELDGDRIADFDPEDRLGIEGVRPEALEVTALRRRGAPTRTPEPFPANAATASGAAPDTRDFFGDASLEATRGWLLGETELTLVSGGRAARLGLDGVFTGAFRVSRDGSGARVDYDATAEGDGRVEGTGRDDDLRGGDRSDQLIGLAGDDVLRGFAGDDALFGGGGADVLIGGPGADRLQGGFGADLFVIGDGDGVDEILDYAPLAGDRIAITEAAYLDEDLTLLHARLSLRADGDAWLLIGDPDGDGEEAPETLARISLAEPGSREQILYYGDDGANAAGGRKAGDIFDLRGGRDSAFGRGGADRMDGGAGGDRLYGNGGADQVFGGGGGDVIHGGGGGDTLMGGGGKDRMKGGGGGDLMMGGGGKDRMEGGGRGDVLMGGGGNDRQEGGAGKDVLQGQRGRDQLIGGGGRDDFVFRRGDGRDVIRDWQDGRDEIVIETGARSFRQLEITDDGRHAFIDYGRASDLIKVLNTDADELGARDFVF